MPHVTRREKGLNDRYQDQNKELEVGPKQKFCEKKVIKVGDKFRKWGVNQSEIWEKKHNRYFREREGTDLSLKAKRLSLSLSILRKSEE